MFMQKKIKTNNQINLIKFEIFYSLKKKIKYLFQQCLIFLRQKYLLIKCLVQC